MKNSAVFQIERVFLLLSFFANRIVDLQGEKLLVGRAAFDLVAEIHAIIYPSQSGAVCRGQP